MDGGRGGGKERRGISESSLFRTKARPRGGSGEHARAHNSDAPSRSGRRLPPTRAAMTSPVLGGQMRAWAWSGYSFVGARQHVGRRRPRARARARAVPIGERAVWAPRIQRGGARSLLPRTLFLLRGGDTTGGASRLGGARAGDRPRPTTRAESRRGWRRGPGPPAAPSGGSAPRPAAPRCDISAWAGKGAREGGAQRRRKTDGRIGVEQWQERRAAVVPWTSMRGGG